MIFKVKNYIQEYRLISANFPSPITKDARYVEQETSL